MATNITINPTSLKSDVLRHLSVIGKRLKTKDGTSLFQNVTLSSAEEGELTQYISDSAARIAAEFPDFITNYSTSGDSISVTANRENWNSSMSGAFSDSVVAALKACVTYEIISVYAPDYAKKFADDTNAAIQDLRRHFYTLLPPESESRSLSDCIGVVELNM